MSIPPREGQDTGIQQKGSSSGEARPGAIGPGKLRRFLWWLLRFGSLLVVCVTAFLLVTNGVVILSTRGQVLTLEEAASLQNMDCVLVLGCGLRRDGQPSAMLADRLAVGIGAYQRGAAPKMLMTGDHGRLNYDEVNAMKDYALQRGVPSRDVFMDHAGFSTYESMYRARDIFQVKRVVIITQHYHLYRAIYNAQRMGLEAYGVPSDLQRYARQSYFDLREAFARAKDVLWGLFQPEPTYLGQAIPITGDGNQTNDR